MSRSGGGSDITPHYTTSSQPIDHSGSTCSQVHVDDAPHQTCVSCDEQVADIDCRQCGTLEDFSSLGAALDSGKKLRYEVATLESNAMRA